MARFTIYSAVLYSILPLILVAIASFRIRDSSDGSHSYSTAAWQEAWSGNYSTTAIPDALINSLTYCIITLMIALPVGYVIASCIARLEIENKNKTAKMVEFATMIPLALSAVMIGLGILIGLLKWAPDIFLDVNSKFTAHHYHNSIRDKNNVTSD